MTSTLPAIAAALRDAAILADASAAAAAALMLLPPPLPLALAPVSMACCNCPPDVLVTSPLTCSKAAAGVVFREDQMRWRIVEQL